MRLRAPVLDDAPAVLAVLQARDLADLGLVDSELGDVLDEWRASDFDLSADAVVVEADDGSIVGYAVVLRPGSFAGVAPEREGQGIGAQLLGWTQQRERETGRECHRQWIGSANLGGRALLRGAGYRLVRSYWRMTRALAGPIDQTPAPEGVLLRRFDPQRDAVAAHAVDQASFAANPDYRPESLEQFREEHLEAHDFDASLSYVAERSGQLVGVLLSRVWTDDAVGFVDILAVHPDAQRRGVAAALMTRAFSGYAGAGLREAQLGVASDNPRAMALYERVGMTAKFRTDVYERPMERPKTTPQKGPIADGHA